MRTVGIVAVSALIGLVVGFLLGEVIAIVAYLGFGARPTMVRFLAPAMAVLFAVAVPFVRSRTKDTD
ncbi:hypothetical protein CLV63_103260 [Murinocardiopsis flavida]|uniref:Uncharacterized protein n=1 Tax=Murinocardiopsis flavida TaxID=645275 RepID=A0A2P8DQN5_9ACTN|nr:DUF5957 family protein [Murinocardiopsis flavida]PSK99535.1 hypothetical protein CLV63_103260 [Murinocardiopsis flavida]